MPRFSRLPAGGRLFLLSVFGIACLAIVYASFAHTATTSQRPAFDQDQHVTLQIVTAPTRSVIGGIQYDEAATTIHSSHELTIPASGEGVVIQSIVDGIPINVAFTGAEPGKDPTSILLHELRFHLPMRVQTADHSSYMCQSFFGQSTEVFTDFHKFGRTLSIHYSGENQPNTFIRLRIDRPEKLMPLIDVRAAGLPGWERLREIPGN